MATRIAYIALIVGAIACGGCGGGSGSSATAGASGKTTTGQRVVVTARVEQAVFAIVGLGRPITRTVKPRLGLFGLIPLNRQTTRDMVQGQDAGTGLYYTRTTNVDGSGQIALYTDAARTVSAGNMTWVQPTWNNNQLNSYPATIHATYQITAGKFAKDRGTLDITPQDVSGNNETLHLVLTDAQNETVVADFKVVSGVLTGKITATLPNGSSFTGNASSGLDGVLDLAFSFADGSQEALTTNPDGTSTETYDSPNGSQDATGNYDDSGDDTIDYSDGSSETVNVDDSSDDSST